MIIRYNFSLDYNNEVYKYDMIEVVDIDTIDYKKDDLLEIGKITETSFQKGHYTYGVGVINIDHDGDVIHALHSEVVKGLQKDIRDYKINELLYE